MQFKHLLLISLESAPEVVVVPIVERVVYDDATGSGALPAKPSVSPRGMSASQRASPSFVNDLAPGQRRRRWTRRAELRRGRSCGGRAGAWPPQIPIIDLCQARRDRCLPLHPKVPWALCSQQQAPTLGKTCETVYCCTFQHAEMQRAAEAPNLDQSPEWTGMSHRLT